MTAISDPLRKAAVLLVSLDADTADALIEQMPEEMARRARSLMMTMADADPVEQDAVIDEFLQLGSARGDPSGDDGGVEIEAGLARRISIDAPTYQLPQQGLDSKNASSDAFSDESGGIGESGEIASSQKRELFGFLRDTDVAELTLHLQNEHPQTIAVIVTHLPSKLAAEVLSRLSAPTQSAVIRRIVDMGPTDPAMVREVERGLRINLTTGDLRLDAGRRGVKAVTSILNAAGDETQRAILDNLTWHEPELAATFARPPESEPDFNFDDFTRLNDLTLAKIFAHADADVLILGLTGAHPSFVRRMLNKLPPREEKRLRRTLNHLGPTRLGDVERAQRELVELARRLDAQGHVDLPLRHSLSVTI